MKLKTPISFQHRAEQRGGISVGTLLMFCVILLLIAVAGLGYAYMKTNGEKAKLEKAKAMADEEALKTRIAATNAAIASAKAERQAKLAVAKARRDDFLVRAASVTNHIHTVMDKIKSIDADLEALRVGPPGERAAYHPDLVSTAKGLFGSEVPKLPKNADTIPRLESARSLILQVAQSENTEFEPPDSLNTTLDGLRKWAEAAARTQDDVVASIKFLVNQGQIRVVSEGATQQTLQSAMEAQTASFQAGVNKQTTATIETATAAAELAKAKAEAERILNEARMQAERIKRGVEDAKKAQQDEALLKEAGSPEVRQILAVIATPGIMEADGNTKASGKPGPMSYNALVSAGCLLEGEAGMKNLYGVASNPSDRERPRWERRYGGQFLKYPDRRAVVAKAHDTLIRLGPYLVKAGVLEP